MSTGLVWPSWLSAAQLSAIQALTAQGFQWTVGNQAADVASEVRGQWARGVAQEVNVVLRAPRGDKGTTSFVGVYPRGQGFWYGGREPSMVDADWAHSGTVDEVLDSARNAARQRGAR